MRHCLLLIFAFNNVVYCQNAIQTKKVDISMDNKKYEFNVCVKEPIMQYADSQVYVWYHPNFGLRGTKGGSGGNLLHGSYKVYFKNGILNQYGTYFLGCNDGTLKCWDSTGDLNSIAKFVKGKLLYSKRFDTEKKRWIEDNYPINGSHFLRRKYTKSNILVYEEQWLPNGYEHIKIFDEIFGSLVLDYILHGDNYRTGAYKEYYMNGQIKVMGSFYETKKFLFSEIKIGEWKYYNENGELDAVETYMPQIEYWNNGNFKVTGGFVKINNNWIKTGEWIEYDSDEREVSKKIYD